MSAPRIDRIDHFVLTVKDVEASCRFYERVLGLKPVEFQGRKAIQIGRQKVNLHRAGHEFEPHAKSPIMGAGDFCLISDTPLDDVVAHLKECGVSVEQGPVPKTGAQGPMRSIYFRDPDGNLVEISNYL